MVSNPSPLPTALPPSLVRAHWSSGIHGDHARALSWREESGSRQGKKSTNFVLFSVPSPVLLRRSDLVRRDP